ncbi:glycoside hydrolase family 43 protein [Mucilaginibacter sp. SMC90]|uniref:glycoside hydrolase family 43 protein n=1 Tax=Mucilaginibacter sp. SMC90 TaxID=2929803 RepID=UPI001FB216EE|nr:glycoside hydrolase family 43 protein [Mucilaginibacter sp. SMC90]UOE52633.1 glycoside hydrolase family 43 protein [Mucilaginibacter sp. SMC90]
MKKQIITLLLCVAFASTYAQTNKIPIRLADPTIFLDEGTYYLYGTGAQDGFGVYTSTDLKNWHQHSKNALLKGESYGTKGFWAPQVFKYKNEYFMAYTADEHIAIAKSDNPLGPFKQTVLKSISVSGKQIDPFIFMDTNGELYLYFVRLQEGNRIFCARFKNGLEDVDENSITECIHAEQGWENTANTNWPVSEGPTVKKIGNLYYLFYSANDFRNIDYAVGYATSPSPVGPWTKYSGNPIISRANTGQNGSGHGDLFLGKDKKTYYVLHTHESNENTGKRKTGIVEITTSNSNPAIISIKRGSFRYLEQEE